MEMNQKMFDECSQKYKQDRTRENETNQKREDLWVRIEQNARKNPKYREFVFVNNLIEISYDAKSIATTTADTDDIEDISLSSTALVSRKDTQSKSSIAKLGGITPGSGKKPNPVAERVSDVMPRDTGRQSALEKYKQTHSFSLITPTASKKK